MLFLVSFVALLMCIANAMIVPEPEGIFLGFLFGAILGSSFINGIFFRMNGN